MTTTCAYLCSTGKFIISNLKPCHNCQSPVHSRAIVVIDYNISYTNHLIVLPVERWYSLSAVEYLCFHLDWKHCTVGGGLDSCPSGLTEYFHHSQPHVTHLLLHDTTEYEWKRQWELWMNVRSYHVGKFVSLVKEALWIPPPHLRNTLSTRNGRSWQTRSRCFCCGVDRFFPINFLLVAANPIESCLSQLLRCDETSPWICEVTKVVYKPVNIQ